MVEDFLGREEVAIDEVFLDEDSEQGIGNLIRDYPDQTVALLAVIGKVRSDLLELETRLRGWARASSIPSLVPRSSSCPSR